jgi:hypothetical protein
LGRAPSVSAADQLTLAFGSGCGSADRAVRRPDRASYLPPAETPASRPLRKRGGWCVALGRCVHVPPDDSEARSAQDRGLIAGAASASRHPRRSRSCARRVGCSWADRRRTPSLVARGARVDGLRPRRRNSCSASSACSKDRRTGARPDVSRAQRRACVGWKWLGRPTLPSAIGASKAMRWRPLSVAEASLHNLGLRRREVDDGLSGSRGRPRSAISATTPRAARSCACSAQVARDRFAFVG